MVAQKKSSRMQVLRGLLHPAALPWLRDPYDLEDESFRELWAAPLGAQLAGSARSFAVVAAATVAAVHLPVRAAAPASAGDVRGLRRGPHRGPRQHLQAGEPERAPRPSGAECESVRRRDRAGSKLACLRAC